MSLLRNSQYVLIACPLTDETTALIGEDELKIMRPDSVLVNAARAEIVEERALIRALKKGRIRAAALDVIENYPLESGHEYMLMDNLILTPHMGGYSHDYPDSIFAESVNVIISLSKCSRPPWIVNKEVKAKWHWLKTSAS